MISLHGFGIQCWWTRLKSICVCSTFFDAHDAACSCLKELDALPGPGMGPTPNFIYSICLLSNPSIHPSVRIGRRERVPGAGGAAGRVRVARVGHQQPAAADGQRRAAHADLRHQGPDAEGDGHPVGRAHHRLLALQLLQRPAVGVGHDGGRAGPDHGPRVRGAAGAAVPAGRRPARAHGLRLPQRLRRGLLQGRHGQPGPAVLGPGAAQRQEHRRAGRHLRQRPGHLPGRLRRRHGQDGLRRRAHRHQRQGQGQLQSRLIHRHHSCGVVDSLY
uniref:Uncharacterized protein n=1 Tax=Zea mays TaxID=4577 RepID=B4FIZ6_MAIZE|nr:unknown [Zea mays]